MVEDEPLFRDLLTTSLNESGPVRVVGAFASGLQALERIAALVPDVAILDINLGGGENGVEVGLKMRRVHPRMGVVLLSNHDEPGVLKAIPRNEVSGWCYLLKRSVSNLHTVLRTIEAAASGLVVLDPDLVRAYESLPTSRIAGLTARQREVLALIAQGYSNLAIAETLGITLKSVENYITQLYQALGIEANHDGMHARVSATLAYLQENTPHF